MTLGNRGWGFGQNFVNLLGLDTIAANVDILLARLTALRAGYLDELGPTNIPADIDTLLARLTALRAGYLDELAAANIPADIDTILVRIGNAPVLTKATLGASNFFTGAVTVITLTPAGPSELGGVSVSHNGFTAGATITYRIYKMTNGVEDQIREWTRIAGTDLDGVVVIDSPDIIDGTGALATWRLTAQSNNAGDAARTMRYQYTLKRII